MRRAQLGAVKQSCSDEKEKSQKNQCSILKGNEIVLARAKSESLPDERRESEGCGSESAARASDSAKAGRSLSECDLRPRAPHSVSIADFHDSFGAMHRRTRQPGH